MSRRRGSATALNASEVVAALAMLSIYSHTGICQALFTSPSATLFLCCVPLKMAWSHAMGYAELNLETDHNFRIANNSGTGPCPQPTSAVVSVSTAFERRNRTILF
jgi:hypothetical protein